MTQQQNDAAFFRAQKLYDNMQPPNPYDTGIEARMLCGECMKYFTIDISYMSAEEIDSIDTVFCACSHCGEYADHDIDALRELFYD